MTTQNLTDWFNLSEQKPWEPGVYEVDIYDGSNGDDFCYWDGRGWGLLSANPSHAKSRDFAYTSFRIFRWRGLSSDPNAKPGPKPKPKAQGNRKVTRYVVAETVGWFTDHINPDAIHGSYANKKIAEDAAKRLRANGHCYAEVFKTKRFRTPEAD